MTKPPVSIAAFLAWLFLFEGILVAAIILVSINLPAIQVPLISVIAIIGIIVICRAALKLLWNRMLAEYPLQEIPAHAESKRFQSFGLNFVNMGLCIKATADDTFLHIEPMLLIRALGAASASIPFADMTPNQGECSVRVGPWTLHGPKWCLARASD
jgi:hypothetical protein